MKVRVDEGALLNLAINPTGNFVSTGKLLAVGKALFRGDPAPLLGLGRRFLLMVIDIGDPTGFSRGDYYAAQCVVPKNPGTGPSQPMRGRNTSQKR
jgi:hypothetical protein